MDRNESLIRVRDLHRAYREGDRSRVVLDGINLDVPQGEIVGLLGRSGSGKSTLLNLLAGIDRADQGEVWIAGIDLQGGSERRRTLFRRTHIGFVYQFFNLIPTLTAADNIRLPLELNGAGTREAQVRVYRLLESVGLEDRGGAFPDDLSGGEQQRVAVARALAHRPPVVLADEPTGNLDAETGKSVMDLLARMVVEHGTTLILVTHSAAVAGFADRCLTLEAGRLSGDHDTTAW
ncbi:MAG: ABC transporter ATP-binding protein [Pseudomonadota bacterium]|nr:ABC transporter ATP-binding protein [Pseudomonadota bacterium]